MQTRSLAITLIILGLLIQPLFLVGQTPAVNDWSGVKALPVEGRLLVETKDGKKIEGKLESVSDTDLSLSRKDKTVTVEKSDVKKIYRIGREPTAKTLVIGTGIGAAVGAIVGVAALAGTGGSDDTGGVLTKFIAAGAALGATAGALGLAFKKRTLVYESK
jgi:hypothetical protein